MQPSIPRRWLEIVLCVGALSCAGAPAPRAPQTGPSAPAARAGATPTPKAAGPDARSRHKHVRAIVGRPAGVHEGRDASLAQLCVDEINRYRATLGLRPLERAPDGEACADDQIRDDAQSGHWHGRFGKCRESAQNECMASAGPRDGMIRGCLQGMWNEGPGGGHYENMRGGATRVWCGFYTAPNGDNWAVQDFR